MNLKFDRRDLLNIASQFDKVANAKATKLLPIMGTLLFEVNNNEVTVVAYNLELGARTTTLLDGLNTESGSFTVDSKTLIGCLNKIGTDSVDFEINEKYDKLVISSSNGRTKYDLTLLSAKDFPELPKVEDAKTAEIPKNAIVDGINRVLYAVNDSDNNLNFKGLNIVNEDGNLYFRAIDGYRLAEDKIVSGTKEDFSAIIDKSSAKFVKDIAAKSSNSDDDKIEVAVTDNHCLFKIDGIEIICRKYSNPDFAFANFIKGCEDNTVITVKKDDFIENINMILPIVTNTFKFPIKMNIDAVKQVITIDNSSDRGRGTTEFSPTSIEGKDLMIAFNATYLLDAVSNIAGDEITIKLHSGVSPVRIYSSDENNWALVLPMRIKNEI